MAEPTAHTEAPGGQRAFPPFEAQHFPSQLFWLALTFVLLYVLMSRIALPRIAGFCRAQQAHRRRSGGGAAASGAVGRGQRGLSEVARRRARPRAGIANETREQQAAEAAATNKQLEAQLHEKLAAAEQSIAATRSAAMGNVGSIAAGYRRGHRRTLDRNGAGARRRRGRGRRSIEEIKFKSCSKPKPGSPSLSSSFSACSSMSARIAG